jgi:hypothetical protein
MKAVVAGGVSKLEARNSPEPTTKVTSAMIASRSMVLRS